MRASTTCMNPAISSLMDNWDLWPPQPSLTLLQAAPLPCGVAGNWMHLDPAAPSQREPVSSKRPPSTAHSGQKGPFPTVHSQHTGQRSHGRTEFSRELNAHPQQLHRDGESCSKEAGKWGGAGAATSCGQAVGRMGWLQTCSAPSRGEGAPVSSLIAIHYENLKAKIAALS